MSKKLEVTRVNNNKMRTDHEPMIMALHPFFSLNILCMVIIISSDPVF